MFQRQSDDEIAAAIRAVALDRHRAAVHLGNLSGKGQTDAESAFIAIATPLALDKKIKHSRQHFGKNSDAVVADREHGGITDALGANEDFAAIGGVLGCVRKQVGEYLLDASRVDIERHRFRSDFERQSDDCGR